MEAPSAKQRPYGGIEGSAGGMDKIGGKTQETEHRRLHDDGAKMSVAMDTGEGGLGEVGGKPCLDA